MEKDIYHASIDFEKAFDSVDHDILWVSLLHLGINHKIIALLKSLYDNAECYVRLGNTRSDSFKRQRGVRQGCIIGSILFNIFRQQIVNDAEINDREHGVLIQGHTMNYLVFADEIDILTTSESSCNLQIEKFWHKASLYMA